MKLRNIFTALVAAALAFVGCQKESRFLDEVQVSKSVVTLPVAGGQDKITVTATDVWAIAVPDNAWFTVDKVVGVAGETEVTFAAEATTETREVNVDLVCAGAVQTIKVLQMAEKVEVPLSTCAEVNNNGVDGKVYRVKGTCTSIANTQYGNWYLTDETGTVYVYGTLYNGATQQFTKLGLEVGDIVTVEGPRKNYNGTIELVDVTVLEIEKSLIKLEKMFSTPLPLEGGVATALLTVKSGKFSVEIPEDATWLTAGEPTTIGGLTSVELTAAPNEGGARKTTVTFKTTVDGKDYIAMADVEQAGAIKAVTVAEFLAAAEGTALFELTGVVKNIKNTVYGNFDLVDATGSVYVYGLTNNGAVGSNDKTFASLGINEGDKITIVGTRGAFNGSPQVAGTAYLVSHVAAQAATVDEFLAAPVSSDKWYKLTGTIESIVKEQYGNFYLQDESGRVYVYGLTKAPVAKNDQSFASLGLKAGDTVTLVGTRAQYASSSVEDQREQVGGPAYYVSHQTPSTEEPETPAEPETPSTGSVTIELSASARPCADFPNTSAGVTTTTTYTIGDYEWTFSPSSGNKFSWYSDGYVLWGKSGGYIMMPAVAGKKLTKVTILTGKNASVNVMVGVYNEAGTAAVAGGEAIKLATQNAEFSWNLTGTEAGAKYQLRVTSAHNAQFQKLVLVYE